VAEFVAGVLEDVLDGGQLGGVARGVARGDADVHACLSLDVAGTRQTGVRGCPGASRRFLGQAGSQRYATRHP